MPEDEIPEGAFKLVVNERNEDVGNIPLTYVNHVRVRTTGEDVFMTLYQRLDSLGQTTESKEFRVDARPVAVLVTSREHASRWVEALQRQLEILDGD